MNFKEYSFNRELNDFYTEIFHKSTFMNQTPENGYWEPSEPENQEDGYKFFYSLPSDPQKQCGITPCYLVYIQNGEVSFRHKDTGIDDRWSYNKHTGNAMQIAREQINAILYAVGTYVQKVQPTKLIWTPVEKSEPGAANIDARKNVYFLWAAKNLWPDYIPSTPYEWTRKDKYNSKYGMPDNLDQMSAKQFLKWIENKKQEEREERRREEDEYRRRQQEEIDQDLQNPEINPNNVKLDDIVIVNDTDNPQNRFNGKLYKIIRFHRYYDGLQAYIEPYIDNGYGQPDDFPHTFSTADRIRVNVKFLHKNTEDNMFARTRKVNQHKQEQERIKQEKIKELLADPEINPNKLELNDEVFVHAYTTRQGLYGKIVDFQTTNDSYGNWSIQAIVQPIRDNDYDQGYQSTRDFDLDDLVKATPENRRIRQFNLPNLRQGRGYSGIQKPEPNWQPQSSTSSDPSPSGANIE